MLKNIAALLITLLLTPFKQKNVDISLQNWSLKFLKEIQTLIVEYIIDQFLLTMCQMKRFKQSSIKIIRF